MKPTSIFTRTNRLVLALLLLLSTGQYTNSQQLFSYTQYMNNLIPLNTTASLLDNTTSVSGIVRAQWVGMNGAPLSFNATLSLPFEKIGAAGGVTVLQDKFALENLTEINAFFAKSVQLSAGKYLAVSLNAGFRRYVANYSLLDATDPQFKEDVQETRPNVGFGVLYYTDRYYIGASVPQLTKRSLGTASSTSNNNFRSHYNFSAAYLFGAAGADIRVKTAALGIYSKGVPFVADLSPTVYLKSTLGVGVNYRTNAEFAGILSYISDQFKLGYSYQFSTSGTNIASGFNNNTHEITLTYRFGSHVKERRLL
jgi:type IX secretion system PorP/SprF family membrane protein